MNEPQLRPFRPLGKRLQALRNRVKESVAEVSGAVEIEPKELASYEMGQSRPSEDILLLLINHFSAEDDEAVGMWEMAGYGSSQEPELQIISEMQQLESTVEQPVLFTDIVDIAVNNYGVTMNFLQSSGPGAKPRPVARVGMSREHAKSVLQILKITLAQTERRNSKLSQKFILPDNNKPDEHRNS